jgi:hypothetical protein
MPAGAEITVPVPVPLFVTVRVPPRSNLASQVISALSLTWAVGLEPALEHAPPQLVKIDPEAAVAVSATGGFGEKGAVQVEPHIIPVGTEVSVPLPVPLFVIIRTDAGLKVAVQLWSEVSVTCALVFMPADAQSPPQLVNEAP